MTARSPRRSFLREVARHGWRIERFTGSGHIRLRHERGAVATVASTPGGARSEQNELALLKRLARQNHGTTR